MIFREAQARMEMVRNSVVKVFAAKYNPRYLYPYALQSATRVRPSGRETCYELIIDSGYADDEVTNETVIQKAEQYGADYIVPKDYPGDRHKTRESMKEFFEMYDAQSRRAKPWMVLQPPYATEYAENEEFYEDYSFFALGGLQDYSPAEQAELLKDFREVAGMNAYVHAFGIGTSLDIVKTIRNNPNLVDSVDMSTAEKVVSKNVLFDEDLNRQSFALPGGTDSTSTNAQFSAALLYMLNFILNPDEVEKEEVEEVYHEQTKLGDLDELMQDSDMGSRHDVTVPRVQSDGDQQTFSADGGFPVDDREQ